MNNSFIETKMITLKAVQMFSHNLALVLSLYQNFRKYVSDICSAMCIGIYRTLSLIDLAHVAELMGNTHTKTGLTVVVRVVDKDYPIKQPSESRLVDKKRVIVHPELDKFTYCIKT